MSRHRREVQDNTAGPNRMPLEAASAGGSIPAFVGGEIPHERPFVCELQVGEDQAHHLIEHVPNTTYLEWLDRAAELHAEHCGYERKRLLDDGIMWFVARHEIDYCAEVFPADHLVVMTWVRDIQRIKSWRDTVIVRPADETVVCRGSTLWVLVKLADRRPIRVPQGMATALDPLQRPVPPGPRA